MSSAILLRERRGGREQVLGGKRNTLPPRCANYGVYNLHAGVVVSAADRAGLERLCRYVAGPLLSASRLEVLEGPLDVDACPPPERD